LIFNNTIADNESADQGGGTYFWYASPKIVNSILWGNNGGEISHEGSSIAVTYSDIQGGYSGTGNIDQAPLFVGSGDYHLTAFSPCIDTGTSDGAPDRDIDGNSRPLGAGYDMGVDEYLVKNSMPWIPLLLLNK